MEFMYTDSVLFVVHVPGTVGTVAKGGRNDQISFYGHHNIFITQKCPLRQKNSWRVENRPQVLLSPVP